VTELLGFTIVIEPDRQRLVRLIIDTVQTLGGDHFEATAALVTILPRLREDCLKANSHTRTQLVLQGPTLLLEWDERRETLVTFTEPPGTESLQALRAHLRHASESTDPALLIQRNARISADLEQAREQAAQEMAELEQVLEKKKRQLKESIQRAERDSLTGLFNRGAFDTRFSDIFRRCQRQEEPLCLVFLDLDNFKQVNDTHGHQFGDDYLKMMADAIRDAAREHVDYACRLGGDEFAIIACTHADIARRMSRKILESLKHSVSIGIAQMQAGDTMDSLIGRADAALYEVKRNGRGHIVLADESTNQRKTAATKLPEGTKTGEVTS